MAESVILNRLATSWLLVLALIYMPLEAHGSPLAAPPQDLSEVAKLSESHSFYKARKILEPLLAKFPDDPKVHLAAASLFLKMGQTTRALEEFQRVRVLTPGDRQTLVSLAKLYLDNGEAALALSTAREALVVDPSSKPARMILVEALMTRGLLLGAEEELKKLLRGDAGDAKIHFMAARLYRDRGQSQLALSHIEDAIRLAPAEYNWLLVKTDICVSLAQYKEAKKAIEYVVECEPHSINALNKLASIKENYFRDYNGATECYRRILEIDPDSVTALAGLDRLRAKKNDLAGQWKHQLRSVLGKSPN